MDLRNGSSTKAKIRSVEGAVKSLAENDEGDSKMAEHDLRRNPDVEAVLQQVMCPEGPHARGNWGRWNFNGPGPLAGVPVTIKRGVPGAVLSVGGCMDQTIHADTPHIFTHTQVGVCRRNCLDA